MNKELDVYPRNLRTPSLLEVMRGDAAGPLARIRNSKRRHMRAHKELIHLVQRLFLSGKHSPQAVVFSAVEPGSGCTYVCTRTAEILANQLEEPVCLVDANFRSPGLNEEFEYEQDPNAPRYDEWNFMPVGDNAEESRKSNLWLISYRPATPDCPRAASLERFQTLIDDLRKDFSYILIDAPPLNEYSDAAMFGRMADGLVLVLKANDTRRDTAERAKRLLDESDVPVLGAVLNRRTYPIPEPLYRRL